MPILSLGSLEKPENLTEQWKADLIVSWKTEYNRTLPIYGKGLVEGTSGTWEQIYLTLVDRYQFDHPEGEVPEELVLKWKTSWDASVASDPYGVEGSIQGYPYTGPWNFVFSQVRKEYLHGQARSYRTEEATEAATLYLQAERAAAKFNLDIYGILLRDYGTKLSSDEKEFFKSVFIDWRRPKSQSEIARAESLFNRIGFFYQSPKQIVEALHAVFTAAGGTEEEWNMSQPAEIISNGGGNGITAVDWNQEQSNQKVVTAMKDSTYISPLQTMYMTTDTKQQTAADVASEMVRNYDINAQTEQLKKISPITWLGIGFLALKLLGR